MEEIMETIDNPFEKHQELITHLMLSHMSSFSVRGYLTSMLGHSQVLSSETFGQLNERQRESLDIVINNSKRLYEHLSTFIIATRLMFNPDRIYEIDCDLVEIIDSLIKQLQETTDFQIKTKLTKNIPEFKADANLISHAIYCIGEIIKQTHPTHKEKINITTKLSGDLIEITFSTNMGETIPQINENPDLFIAHTVAKLHNGDFIVDTNDKTVNLILTISMSAYS